MRANFVSNRCGSTLVHGVLRMMNPTQSLNTEPKLGRAAIQDCVCELKG